MKLIFSQLKLEWWTSAIWEWLRHRCINGAFLFLLLFVIWKSFDLRSDKTTKSLVHENILIFHRWQERKRQFYSCMRFAPTTVEICYVVCFFFLLWCIVLRTIAGQTRLINQTHMSFMIYVTSQCGRFLFFLFFHAVEYDYYVSTYIKYHKNVHAAAPLRQMSNERTNKNGVKS